MGILGNLNSFVLGSVIRPKRNHQQSPYPLGVCNQMKETRVQKRTSENVLSSCTKRWLCNSGHTHTQLQVSPTLPSFQEMFLTSVVTLSTSRPRCYLSHLCKFMSFTWREHRCEWWGILDMKTMWGGVFWGKFHPFLPQPSVHGN